MVSVATKGKDFVLMLSQEEFNKLGLNPSKEYELIKAKQGIWVLTEKEEKIEEGREADEKIFSLLRSLSLKERVEGRFEKHLGKKELLQFKKLLKEKRVLPFKLSKKYKRAIYKSATELEREKHKLKSGFKESETINAREKPIEEYSLEKDGFLVCKNEQRAKRISNELKEQIKEGNIKGIRCFEGYFYITENNLYQKYRNAAIEAIKGNNSITLNELVKKMNVSKILTKIVCEFLKEEGEIIEKRKECYQFVE